MTTPRLKDFDLAFGGALRCLYKKITADDLTASATSQAFTVGALPTGAIVVGCSANVITAVVGLAGTTTYDVGVNGGSGNEYLASGDAETTGYTSVMPAEANSDGNGVTVDLTVTDTVTDVDQASAFEMEVKLIYLESTKVVRTN